MEKHFDSSEVIAELLNIKNMLKHDDITYVNSGLLLLESLLENEDGEVDFDSLFHRTQFLSGVAEPSFDLLRLYEYFQNWPYGTCIAWFLFSQKVRCHPEWGLNVTELNLMYDEGVEHLNFDWSAFANLKMLSLGLMKVETLPSTIEILRLPESRLELVKEDLLSMEHLHTLIVTEMEELPSWLNQLTSVQKLVLIHSSKSKIPDVVCQMPNLKHLEIDLWDITSVPDQLKDLSLEVFAFNVRNPSCIISNVTALRLQRHRHNLDFISPQLVSMERLQILDLRDCLLNAMPKWLSEIGNLQQLNLSFNQVKQVALDSLPSSLEKLNLAHNQIRYLNKGWDKLSSLTTLDLSHNRIIGISEDFASQMGTKVINLSGNPLKNLPSQFHQLQLDSQLFSKFEDVIIQMPHLTSLTLSGEYLTELPAGIQKCQHLQVLDVSNNELSKLPDWVSELPNLQNVIVSGNPLDATDSDESEGLFNQ